ncbi:MAG: hypothetical protein ABI742_00505 [Gemmatimonadota bacterium]
MRSEASSGRPAPGWEWNQVRDRAQVGAYFGLLAGVVALVIVLTWAGVRAALGRAVPALPLLRLHGCYVVMYLFVGALLGALWPLRRSRLGHWFLRVLAACAAMVTLISIRHGSLFSWPAIDWLWLALSAPLFAWVFGGSSRRATQPG